MENKSQVNGSSSSSSSLHHLFSPKDSSSLSSTSEILGSIFPPPPPVQGKASIHSDHTADGKGQSNGTTNNDKSSSIYHSETMEPCYLSSSIYYGGQEYYSPKQQTTDAPLYFRKEGEEDDPIGINSNGASRAIGGRAHCITNVSIQNNANVSTQGMVELDQPYYYG